MYGRKIKNLLKRNGISQIELSELINTPRTTISHWLKQSYPPLENIEKVCKALNMPIWEFFIEDEDKKNPYNLSNDCIDFCLELQKLPEIFRGRFFEVTEEHLQLLLDALEKKR